MLLCRLLIILCSRSCWLSSYARFPRLQRQFVLLELFNFLLQFEILVVVLRCDNMVAVQDHFPLELID